MVNQSIKAQYSDDDFLKAVVSSVKFLCQAIPKQMTSIKNSISEHIFCSDYFAQLFDIDANEIIGKKIWLPLYENDTDFETIIIEEDQAIMSGRSQVMVFKINRFHTGLTPYTAIKSPLINPSTNKVVGILVQGFEMSAFNFQHYIDKVSYSTNNESYKIPSLSKREKQVIFFFLANLSSQEIAEIIYKIEGRKISKSTIDSVFNDQLYEKFNVHSRPALYKILQKMGYEKMIPKELLTCSSITLDVLSPY